MRTLLVIDLGTLEYSNARALQEALLEKRQAGELADMVLIVEHPHVFTIGVAGKEQNLLDRGTIPFFRTSRGGDITYHGPGQVVFYPILDLRSRLRKAVHVYLDNLEQATIRTLRSFGISARIRPPWTGIWINHKKIASIGIAVRKGVSYHGMALNVCPDLGYFARIVPCGLSWAGVTSMENELAKRVAVQTVKLQWVRNFAARAGYTDLEELCPEDIPIGSKLNPLEASTTSG